MRPASKAFPCPVCGGDHKCSWKPDFELIFCGRSTGEVPGFRCLGPCKKDATWTMYKPDDKTPPAPPVRPYRPKTPRSPTMNLQQLAEQAEVQLTPALKKELAAHLGLPVDVLDRIRELGYAPNKQAWLFPERNSTGALVGLVARHKDGSKRALAGSQRGLTIAVNFDGGPGPIFLVEGATDVLALCAVGLNCLGRPSNKGGLDDLATWLQEWRIDKPVIFIGENDCKEIGGLWPGRDGARDSAEGLAQRMKRAIHWTMPPQQYKDVRAWIVERLDPNATLAQRDELGREIASVLTRSQVSVEWKKNKPEHAIPGAVLKPRKFPTPRMIGTLKLPSEDGVAWVWDGFLARDAVTLLSALPKCGKTTLLSHLLAQLAHGGEFCGRKLVAGRALIVSEEPEGVWAARRDQLGIAPEAVSVISRGEYIRGNAEEWDGFLNHLAELADAHRYDLIVFDTLANLWPVRDENSAAEMGATLAGLHKLTGGRAVLLVHHLRKSDGKEGTGSRGSGALGGFVDVIVELRRARDIDDLAGTRRVLTGLGRYAAIPNEWPIEMVLDGEKGKFVHRDAGQPKERIAVRKALALKDAIKDILPKDGSGLTRKEIWDRLPEELRRNEVRFRELLTEGEESEWKKLPGKGKGAGFLYLAI